MERKEWGVLGVMRVSLRVDVGLYNVKFSVCCESSQIFGPFTS